MGISVARRWEDPRVMLPGNGPIPQGYQIDYTHPLARDLLCNWNAHEPSRVTTPEKDYQLATSNASYIASQTVAEYGKAIVSNNAAMDLATQGATIQNVGTGDITIQVFSYIASSYTNTLNYMFTLNNARFGIRSNGKPYTWFSTTQYAVGAITEDRWLTLTARRKAGTIEWWEDIGKDNASNANTNSLSDGEITIDCNSGGGLSNLNCKMGRVTVWRRALDEQEIRAMVLAPRQIILPP